MLQEVNINGTTQYVDVNNQILYNDRDKKSGIPFQYLSFSERERITHELRFPKAQSEE